MTDRLCAHPHCGQPFRPRQSVQRYCSQLCASRDPGRWITPRAPRLAVRICEYDGCARPFRQKRPEQRFCSQPCAARNPSHVAQFRTVMYRSAPRQERICEYDRCGGSFLPTRPEQRFCSQPCASRARSWWLRRDMTCPCGATFSPRRPSSKYCTVECAKQRAGWCRRLPVQKRPCGFCGQTFVVPVGRRRQRYCSRECAASARVVHPPVQVPCECGRTFTRTGEKPHQRYCSRECARRFVAYGRSYGVYEERQYGMWRS